MGDKLIWIAASFAYGAVTAAIYTFICWRRRRSGLAKRAGLSFVGYTAFGLILVHVLWVLMG